MLEYNRYNYNKYINITDINITIIKTYSKKLDQLFKPRFNLATSQPYVFQNSSLAITKIFLTLLSVSGYKSDYIVSKNTESDLSCKA